MSKFDKTCPQCGAANAAGAVQCACGYLFNPLYLEDPRLALELAVREEKLIEEYLSARAEQAAEAAKAASQRADVDRENARKAVEAAVTQLDEEVAKAELAEQHARVAEAESKLEAHIAEAAQATKAADTESWQAIIVAEARKAKNMQAAVAHSAKSVGVIPSEEPGTMFRTAQAAKAEKVVKAAQDLETMTCPACGATISAAAAACRCGWSISRSLPESATPSRTLHTDDHATLKEHVETKKSTKPR